MWFKNLSIFEFLAPFEIECDALEKALSDHKFIPCGSSVPISTGWVSPFSTHDGPLIHQAQGAIMIAFQVQEKIVPASVVKELLDEKVEEIELRESRKVKKKEKDTLKEEIFQTLLPRAFTRNTVTYAYIDQLKGLFIVNAASSKKADLVTVNLRKALGSLKIRIPELLPISMILTNWVKTNEYPQSLTIEDQCVLQDNEDSSGVIRCQKQNLLTEDIQSLIDTGREVVQLGLSWQEQLSFILNDEFMIKSIKYLEYVQDKANDIVTETKEARFDADFTIMVETLREFVSELLAIFAKHQKEQNEHNDQLLEEAPLEEVNEEKEASEPLENTEVETPDSL